MPSKRSLVPRNRHLRLLTGREASPGSSICPFCSLVPTARAAKAPSNRHVKSRRYQSTSTATNPRFELEQALLELQKRAPGLVNPSRLQLALQGLRQVPGQEAVRVAILGLANGSDGRATARRVLKALLTDPLVDEQEWERKLDQHDTSQPLIVRVGPSHRVDAQLELRRDSLPHELNISSAELNGLNLELLLMGIEVPSGVAESISAQSLEEVVLLPGVPIPAAENRITQLSTPVHQALLVADGLMGAVGISAMKALESSDAIVAAVDMKGLSNEKLEADFVVIDTSLAEESIRLFRKGPQHAMEYERRWSASNLATLVTWLKAGIKATDDDATKPAVRKLIASVLQSALAGIEAETINKTLSKHLSSRTPEMRALNEGLAEWAESAHAELQEQLDLAFTGRRWRKLGWWKLFWRVDDVAMLTNEMLSQRLLPTAEQELVYLTGRIAQLLGEPGQYPQPTSSREQSGDTKSPSSQKNAPVIPTAPRSGLPKWPGHIAFTRRYLQNETVPALQSLAQRLVLQSLATSSLTSCLAALLYVSSFSSTFYEAGAVAALGIVYSLGRMQKKWEAGRVFWEGEVREEGRKAVRAAEESAAEVLDYGKPNEPSAQRAEELKEARELLARAADALERMK